MKNFPSYFPAFLLLFHFIFAAVKSGEKIKKYFSIFSMKNVNAQRNEIVCPAGKLIMNTIELVFSMLRW